MALFSLPRQDPRIVHRITDVPRDVEDVLHSSQVCRCPCALYHHTRYSRLPLPSLRCSGIATARLPGCEKEKTVLRPCTR